MKQNIPELPTSKRPSDAKQILVGTSGFSYEEWRGGFYPEDLPSKKFLSYYAQHFPTVEINNTFYRIPTVKLTQGWYAGVPESFFFTLKLSQKITHVKKLNNVDDEMEWFLAGSAGLREKLGTVLVQLPPYFRKDLAVIEDFLAKFASKGRLAFEFRHPSWLGDETYRLLEKHESSLAVVEKEVGEGAEAPREVTGPFVYMRLRKGEYSKSELLEWAKWIRKQTGDVYCYLKHDEKAPLLAKQLIEALSEV